MGSFEPFQVIFSQFFFSQGFNQHVILSPLPYRAGKKFDRNSATYGM